MREPTTDLDDEQRAAVVAPRGPVCVLAGAGTGKTRAITCRIAHLVRAGHVAPGQVLAVTFTARAAGELRTRLRALGVDGVIARTFHAAALRQLRYFWPRVVGDSEWELLAAKPRLVGQAAHRAGADIGAESLRDLVGEIEWAKASLVAPTDYPRESARLRRETPVAAELVAAVYAGYEQLKQGAGLLDFDDLLLHTAAALETHAGVADEFRERYRCFVVDEYQDVTPLQQRLLDAWLGERDDLTVVGDANQTIYTFAGATPRYLLDFSRRFPEATVVRLRRDYRSTQRVVTCANQVISAARDRPAGTRLRLVGQLAGGPEPTYTEYDDEPAEATATAVAIKRMISGGVPASEIAVLFRVNAQSEAYERALDDAGVCFQVRGAERYLTRPELATRPDAVHPPAAHLTATQPPAVPGVTLASLHAAKGLEWDAVFLVGLVDGTLPIQHADGDAAKIEEERRLLYVGITRARRVLVLSWALSRAGGGHRPRRRSRFLHALIPDDHPVARVRTERGGPSPRSRDRGMSESRLPWGVGRF